MNPDILRFKLTPHLHKKGIDDPWMFFMTFRKIINRSSIGIRSDHPDPGSDVVTAAFLVPPCNVSLTCLFVQDFEWFSWICNVPLTFFLLVQAGAVSLLQPKFLFLDLFWVFLFFLLPENWRLFLIIQLLIVQLNNLYVLTWHNPIPGELVHVGQFLLLLPGQGLLVYIVSPWITLSSEQNQF